jgi:DNA (cytosine-5)-methyltransferase 1
LKESPKYNYKWTLKEVHFKKNKGSVFSCFSGGGGSSLGYKLAGFDVLGCNEIDSRMMSAYLLNNNPKFHYCEAIADFKNRKDLPEELYHLDILDGSPPCSSFSIAGDRERGWGKEKKFREGQVKQVLDTLFFDFINIAKKLQPKIVISENVKGLLLKKSAEKYVSVILEKFDEAGYYTQYYILDSSKMGVPQKRERVFFISIRKDLAEKFLRKEGFFGYRFNIDLNFDYRKIPISEFIKGKLKRETQHRTTKFKCQNILLDKNKPSKTLTANTRFWLDENTLLSKEDKILIQSFPLDYNFNSESENQIRYILGMSVPSVMTAHLADRIYNQILSKIKI